MIEKQLPCRVELKNTANVIHTVPATKVNHFFLNSRNSVNPDKVEGLSAKR